MKISGFYCFGRRTEQVQIRTGRRDYPALSGLTIVEAPEFTFAGLHPHRDMIRRRLLEILTAPPTEAPKWGGTRLCSGAYSSRRLGEAHSKSLRGPFRDGERIPLAWYAAHDPARARHVP